MYRMFYLDFSWHCSLNSIDVPLSNRQNKQKTVLAHLWLYKLVNTS